MGTGLDAARLIAGVAFSGGNAGGGAAAAHGAWTAAPPSVTARALALASAARIDLLLDRALRAADCEVPAELAARATQARAAAAWAWIEGSAVLRALEDAGHSPIALKGADLAARAYPAAFRALADRAYLRHATDLDVLVADPAAAAPVLRGLGYEPSAREEAAHHARWWKRAGAASFSVELHGDLFDRPHGLGYDLAALRARAVAAAAPDGTERRVLAPVDAFLHVAGHAVYSDGLRDAVPALRGPIDLAALARAAPLDEAALAEAAAAWRLDGPLRVALAWCAEVLGGLPPFAPSERSESRGRGFADLTPGERAVLAAAEAALEGGTPPRSPATVSRARIAPTWSAAVAMLLEGLRRRMFRA